jgi:hypothetical protein
VITHECRHIQGCGVDKHVHRDQLEDHKGKEEGTDIQRGDRHTRRDQRYLAEVKYRHCADVKRDKAEHRFEREDDKHLGIVFLER